MRAIHLYGDSIFDNYAYVAKGNAVTDHMADMLPDGVNHILEAIDGDKVLNTIEILQGREGLYTSRTDIGAVLSVGGNDALEAAHVLLKPVTTVAEALTELQSIADTFRVSYGAVLQRLCELYERNNIRICTVYDRIPIETIGLDRSAMTALALFNNIITEAATLYNVKLIDLRVVCADPDSYSTISPIEPSNKGGRRIVEAIKKSYAI